MIESSACHSTLKEPNDPFLGKKDECDLVMKGGITSGIVYPPVVIELAKKHRFRSIGGTSAGAIAAAVTAAAEYGRENGGFGRLDAVNNELKKKNFLLNLFQPSPELKPLMELLKRFLPRSSPVDEQQEKNHPKWLEASKNLLSILKVGFSVRGVGVGFLLTLILAGLSIVAFFVIQNLVSEQPKSSDQFVLWSFLTPLLVIGTILCLLGNVIGSLGEMIFHHLPNNFFGMCIGHTDEAGKRKAEALTDWLCRRTDFIAGLDNGKSPLTFGDLYNKPFSDGGCLDRHKDKKNIDLKMVTTNLSQNQPYTLPFRTQNFLFHEGDFRRLFPCYVVEYLKKNSYKNSNVKLPSESVYHYLPEADKLPVIVATRMSLSFPILLSAVPLYTICASALEKDGSFKSDALKKIKEEPEAWTDIKDSHVVPNILQRNWFSDGGICSNFPIHFFDDWLPNRPTFGINLTTLSNEALEDQEAQRTVNPDFQSASFKFVNSEGQLVACQVREELVPDIYLPKANDEVPPDWIKLDGNLINFLRQILQTSQGYRETIQSRLPGYQERIVQIRLAPGEGGLNLGMEPELINCMMKRGRRAGELLINGFDFNEHQWMRLVLLLGLLEKNFEVIHTKALKSPRSLGPGSLNYYEYSGSLDYECLLEDQKKRPYKYPYSYYGNHRTDGEEATEKAKRSIEDLRRCTEQVWLQPRDIHLQDKLLMEKMVLRIMAEF